MHGCAAAPVCSGSLLAGLSFDGSHIVILLVLSCENILTYHFEGSPVIAV